MQRINVKKEVGLLIGVVFLLLGSLVAVMIIALMLGVFGPSVAASIPQETRYTVNETGSAITTGYALANRNLTGFTLVTIQAINQSAPFIIPATNYTVSANNVITNTTATPYTVVNFTYTYTVDSSSEITANSINNNSLSAANTYSAQAGNQFTTVGITITLVLLVFVFLLFWAIFSDKKKGGSSSRRSNGNSYQLDGFE
jgi:hypothetical protein